MADISAAMVMELRKATGAGIMDCKRALSESDGVFEKAAELLMVKKKATAAKKQSRIAALGVVEAYVHMGGKIGVLCEVNCETDFVAKTPKFGEFVKDICMHIAAMNPAVVQSEEMPADEVDSQRRLFAAQVAEEGKPEAIADRIIQGKMNKWLREAALLDQVYVKDEDKKTVREYVESVTGDLGEKIAIRRFVRFEMGEGLQKREENFADEVAAQVG
jgi:elongation factor Ts